MKKFVVAMILGGLVGVPVFAQAAPQTETKTQKTKKKAGKVKKTSKKKAGEPKAQ